MKNTNAYRIVIVNVDKRDKKFEQLAQEVSSVLTVEELEHSAIEEKNTIEVLYLIIDSLRYSSLINIFNQLNILIDNEDITDLIINNKLHEKELAYIKSNEFMINRVNDLIKYNIDKDFVLDKILSDGINSLTPIEFEVLES